MDNAMNFVMWVKLFIDQQVMNLGGGGVKSTSIFVEIYQCYSILFSPENKYYSTLSRGLCTYLFSCENICLEICMGLMVKYV